MGYYATIGLVLSKDGEQQLKARISSLTKEQATIAHSYMKYVDQKKTHRKTGAKLFIWNAVKEGSDFDLFFGNLVRSLPYDAYKMVRIGDALDDSIEEGDFLDDPFFLHIERNLAFE